MHVPLMLGPGREQVAFGHLYVRTSKALYSFGAR
jgi:hypothetical protein